MNNIKEKIRYLEKEYNFKCNFNKKTTKKEIDLFEKKYALKLPNDYKEFIVEFGNGGSFGFKAFEFYHYIYKVNDEYIRKEFPLTKPYQGGNNEIELDDSIYNGQIVIESGGCGNYTFLVINGAEYGNVWWHELPSNDEIIPFTGFDWENRIKINVRKKFIDWYSDLLDLKIQQISKWKNHT